MEQERPGDDLAGGDDANSGHVAGASSDGMTTPEELARDLKEQCERADRLLVNWQRAEADLANYRRRVDEERGEQLKFASAELLRSTLVILDDLDRALSSVSSELAGFTWLEGIWLIGRKLEAILVAHKVEEIKAQGESLDPNLHQAVAEVEGDAGKVMSVVQRGYTFHGRLLRPALVMVGKGVMEEPGGVNHEPEAEGPPDPGDDV
jgi:molecular chaperone GrpE